MARRQRTKSSKNKRKRGDLMRRKKRIRQVRKDWDHGQEYNGAEAP